jgi:hypothetical protein
MVSGSKFELGTFEHKVGEAKPRYFFLRFGDQRY